MSTLTLDRPSVTRLAASVMDAVFNLPANVARAHEMRSEAEHILGLSDAQIDAMGTTRDALLRDLAQRF